MTINWKLRETVFRLLAAVYAELGEEVFKGRYVAIAQHFGPDATYDAIKSFFNKEVARAAEQLLSKNPGRRASSRGRGRGLPQRRNPRQQRPPLLYFDDEDISILTQREVEAHFSHSLHARPKRPRVVSASPKPPTEEDVPGPSLSSVTPAAGTLQNGSGNGNVNGTASLHGVSARPSPCLSSDAVTSSYLTANGPTEKTATEEAGSSRKRAYSVVSDDADDHYAPPHISVNQSTPKPHSFGYVTRQGQYRCALCLSQLPNEQDLDRHQSLSKEHKRNLENPLKVSKGLEKLAQVKRIPSIGPHISTPTPSQPLQGSHRLDKDLGGNSANDMPPANMWCENGGPPDPSLKQEHAPVDKDIPFDTIEVADLHTIRSQRLEQEQVRSPTPLSQLGMPAPRADKGKGRAVSVLSIPPTPRAQQGQAHRLESSFPSDAEPSSLLHTRPTTARTEIGSITPVQSLSTAGPSRVLETGQAPVFSRQEIADIMRSTELVMQLMSCVQKEAAAVSTAAGPSRSGLHTAASASVADTPRPTDDPVRRQVSAELEVAHSNDTTEASIGPRRQQGERNVKGKRTKDTGEEAFFIIVD